MIRRVFMGIKQAIGVHFDALNRRFIRWTTLSTERHVIALSVDLTRSKSALIAENAVLHKQLTNGDKFKYYELWTEDAEIREVLSRYIDKGNVRVYLKDTLLKGYARDRQGSDARPLQVLGITPDVSVAKRYTKPYGRRFTDGWVVSWGRADDWKAILMALFERTHGDPPAHPTGAVLTNAVGRYGEPRIRAMIEDAATQLGIERIIWLDVGEVHRGRAKGVHEQGELFNAS